MEIEPKKKILPVKLITSDLGAFIATLLMLLCIVCNAEKEFNPPFFFTWTDREINSFMSVKETLWIEITVMIWTVSHIFYTFCQMYFPILIIDCI